VFNPSPVAKTFSTNGALMPNDRYFILDPTPWITQQLKPAVEKGALIMLYSARASGKTTKINFLLAELSSSYHCIL